MNRLTKRRSMRTFRGGDSGGHWISYSDMMASLLLVFILAVCYSVYQYYNMLDIKTQELNIQKEELDRAQITLVEREEELEAANVTLMGKQEGDRAEVHVNEKYSYFVKIISLEKGEDDESFGSIH